MERLHAHFDWFGSSAEVCENIDEFESTNSLPVQRIGQRCAYISVPVNFYGSIENVFIACLIPLKHCI